MQNITDEDVLALVNDEVHQPEVVWVLEDLQASWWLLRELGLVPCGLVLRGPEAFGCWRTCRQAGGFAGSLGWCHAGWF